MYISSWSIVEPRYISCRFKEELRTFDACDLSNYWLLDLMIHWWWAKSTPLEDRFWLLYHACRREVSGFREHFTKQACLIDEKIGTLRSKAENEQRQVEKALRVIDEGAKSRLRAAEIQARAQAVAASPAAASSSASTTGGAFTTTIATSSAVTKATEWSVESGNTLWKELKAQLKSSSLKPVQGIPSHELSVLQAKIQVPLQKNLKFRVL